MSVTSFTAAIEVAWPVSVRWWLKDPLEPANNMEVSMQPGKLQSSATDPQQIVFPIGRPDPIVMADTIKMPTLTSIPFRFLDDSEYQAFERLRATGRVLLLQGPQEVGQWYVRLGDTKTDALDLPTMRGWSTSGILLRDITISAQVVAAP